MACHGLQYEAQHRFSLEAYWATLLVLRGTCGPWKWSSGRRSGLEMETRSKQTAFVLERRGEDLWDGTDWHAKGAEDDSWVFGRWIPFMKFKNPTLKNRLALHSWFSQDRTHILVTFKFFLQMPSIWSAFICFVNERIKNSVHWDTFTAKSQAFLTVMIGSSDDQLQVHLSDVLLTELSHQFL